jgi:hypothetical protein
MSNAEAQDAALWALAVLEAHDQHDAEGLNALLADVDPHLAVARLADLAKRAVMDLAHAIDVSPAQWLRNLRAEIRSGVVD